MAILDMGCGTGNQLIANRDDLGAGLWVGLDLSQGMLRQARAKAPGLVWLQADSARPPFADQCFDFITNQFALHHVQDKAAMLHAVFRLLRRDGRFVMTNICPREMPDWLYYRYFPAAFSRDLQDFLPKETLCELMRRAGFRNITMDVTPITYEQDLHAFLATVRRRDTCSQLLAISEADYQAGLHTLERELAEAGHDNRCVPDRVSLLTLCGGKS